MASGQIAFTSLISAAPETDPLPRIAMGDWRSLEITLGDEEGIGMAFGADGGGGAVTGVDNGGVGELQKLTS